MKPGWNILHWRIENSHSQYSSLVSPVYIHLSPTVSRSPTHPTLYKICSSAKLRYSWIMDYLGKQDKETSISNYPFQIRSLGLVFRGPVLLAVGHELQCQSEKVSVVKLYMAS